MLFRVKASDHRDYFEHIRNILVNVFMNGYLLICSINRF